MNAHAAPPRRTAATIATTQGQRRLDGPSSTSAPAGVGVRGDRFGTVCGRRRPPARARPDPRCLLFGLRRRSLSGTSTMISTPLSFPTQDAHRLGPAACTPEPVPARPGQPPRELGSADPTVAAMAPPMLPGRHHGTGGDPSLPVTSPFTMSSRRRLARLPAPRPLVAYHQPQRGHQPGVGQVAQGLRFAVVELHRATGPPRLPCRTRPGAPRRRSRRKPRCAASRSGHIRSTSSPSSLTPALAAVARPAVLARTIRSGCDTKRRVGARSRLRCRSRPRVPLRRRDPAGGGYDEVGP